MVWGAVSGNGTAGFYFLQLGTTVNGAKSLDLIRNKLNIQISYKSLIRQYYVGFN